MTRAVTRAPARRGAVLAVCGLVVETRIAAMAGVRTVAGGGHSEALADVIEREIDAGAIAIISFGIAGALTGALRPGTLIVADSVVAATTSYPVDAAWSRALARRVATAICAPVAGCDAIVTRPDDKRRLGEASGAMAVDMESHIAARIAARHRLPFVALRAIADPLTRVFPPAAAVAMRADGSVDLAAVLRSIAGQPQQLASLLWLGLDTRSALSRLGDARRLLGRGLGYPNLDQLPLDVV